MICWPSHPLSGELLAELRVWLEMPTGFLSQAQAGSGSKGGLRAGSGQQENYTIEIQSSPRPRGTALCQSD